MVRQTFNEVFVIKNVDSTCEKSYDIIKKEYLNIIKIWLLRTKVTTFEYNMGLRNLFSSNPVISSLVILNKKNEMYKYIFLSDILDTSGILYYNISSGINEYILYYIQFMYKTTVTVDNEKKIIFNDINSLKDIFIYYSDAFNTNFVCNFINTYRYNNFNDILMSMMSNLGNITWKRILLDVIKSSNKVINDNTINLFLNNMNSLDININDKKYLYLYNALNSKKDFVIRNLISHGADIDIIIPYYDFVPAYTRNKYLLKYYTELIVIPHLIYNLNDDVVCIIREYLGF